MHFVINHFFFSYWKLFTFLSFKSFAAKFMQIVYTFSKQNLKNTKALRTATKKKQNRTNTRRWCGWMDGKSANLCGLFDHRRLANTKRTSLSVVLWILMQSRLQHKFMRELQQQHQSKQSHWDCYIPTQMGDLEICAISFSIFTPSRQFHFRMKNTRTNFL